MGVVSGYSGGASVAPTYEAVCRGETGHAEVIQIEFDPEIIGYETLVNIFFATHDPTTPDRQGNDVGTQYRSVIFFHSDAQNRIATEVRAQLASNDVFSAPIVTEIRPVDAFWPAEAYHQNYFERNPQQPYCRAVVAPKVAKFRQRFAEFLVPKP